MNGAALARVAWFGLLAWQWAWHAAWPGGAGVLVATLASLPLLLPLPGILEGRHRPMVWGGFLSVGYFIVGVMEAWSEPASRWPGAVQAILCAVYVTGLFLAARGHVRA